jgi:single-stranded-DNA-specific exonuclease
MKNWKLQKVDHTLTNKLANELNVSKYIAKLLILRGVDSFIAAKNFFRPDLKNVHDPFLMKGMKEAVNRINIAKSQNESVLLFGDYDVDGISAVSMMYTFFKDQNINVNYYIPDRYSEGYGFSKQGIDHAFNQKNSLIITLDCGIRAVQQTAYANSKNIDVIICDHHNVADELPNAISILNPKQPDCFYPNKNLSGCGVGFKFISAYSKYNNIKVEETYKYLDLLALSLIADIMSLTGENRVYTFYGLKKINQNPCLGLKALINLLSKNNLIKASDISFGIAPLINAAGRMSHATNAVKLLIESNVHEAEVYAKILLENNNDRREVEKEITKQALEMIDNKMHTSVVSSTNWHKGVVGIVASKLLEKYYKPTIVFVEKDGFLTGSARSVKGFNIYEAIKECEDLCEKFGGHMYAAGLTIKSENFDLFKIKFENIVRKKIQPEQKINVIDIDLEIDLDLIDGRFYRILKQFEPFGPDNLNPTFSTENLNINASLRFIGEDKSHVKLELNTKSAKINAIGFGIASKFKSLKKQKIDLCYTINENYWNNKTTIQLNIKDVF